MHLFFKTPWKLFKPPKANTIKNISRTTKVFITIGSAPPNIPIISYMLYRDDIIFKGLKDIKISKITLEDKELIIKGI